MRSRLLDWLAVIGVYLVGAGVVIAILNLDRQVAQVAELERQSALTAHSDRENALKVARQEANSAHDDRAKALAFQRESYKSTLGLELVNQFDSSGMRKSRRALAMQLLRTRLPKTFDDIDDTRVIDFFETMGDLKTAGRLDGDMIKSNFGDVIVNYWQATKGLILEARKSDGDDSLYVDFENLNDEIVESSSMPKAHRPRLTKDDVRVFLKGEATLPK